MKTSKNEQLCSEYAVPPFVPHCIHATIQEGGATIPKKKQNKTPEETEIEESNDVLKDMVRSLNELPTDVLQQLLDNLDAIEKYNKEHPEELKKDRKEENDE